MFDMKNAITNHTINNYNSLQCFIPRADYDLEYDDKLKINEE